MSRKAWAGRESPEDKGEDQVKSQRGQPPFLKGLGGCVTTVGSAGQGASAASGSSTCLKVGARTGSADLPPPDLVNPSERKSVASRRVQAASEPLEG